MILEHNHCYAIILARDVKYDGRLFTGVKTTGIYCRPICPARTPKSENVNFYPTAAAAQEAGFRPCLRCRPETAPDTPAWRGTSAIIGRALRLIEQGALDERGVVHLAMRLGIGERQLRRLFLRHLGASPIAVAQTRRVLLAKQLLHETELSMAQVALASGFGSIRRFNEVFQLLFKRPPAQIRRVIAQEIDQGSGGELTIKLRFRAPYDWDGVLAFLAARCYQGMEAVRKACYSRTFEIGGDVGMILISRGSIDCLSVRIRASNLRVVPKLIAAIRHSFDLSADPSAVSEYFSRDAIIKPLVERFGGLRLPCSWDGFEGVVRAVLGQQITVKAAIGLGSRLITELGRDIDLDDGFGHRFNRLFPTPMAVYQADLSFMPMPKSRQATLKAVAQAFVEKPDLMSGRREEVYERLRTIKGVGPWTVDYVALRVLGDVDAFPSGDVALMKAFGVASGCPVTSSQLEQTSHQWRPWRAYAAQYLWSSL